MRYLYYSLIPEPGSSRILMLRDGEAWTLPCHETTEFHPWQEVHHEHDRLMDALGIEVFTLRLVWVDYDEAKGRVMHLYARTNRSPRWQPPADAVWMDATELASLQLSEPDLGPGIEQWHAWQSTTPADKPLPWSAPVWYDSASTWIDKRLADLELTRTAPLAQLTSRPRGSVFRAETDQKAVYFKAVPEMFAHEPALSASLGRWYPDKVPPVLAIDPTNHWFMSAEIKGDRLGDIADLGIWRTALRGYGDLQVALAERTDELAALGCANEPLTTAADRIRSIIEEQLWDVSREKFAPLLAKLPAIGRQCEELSRSALPLSLDHGDLSPWQIIVTDGRPFYTDWSDSSIAHPFLGLAIFFEGMEYLRDAGSPPIKSMLGDWDAVRNALTEAYLETWLDFAPMPTLRALLELALQLAPAHTALNFVRFLSHGIDTQWDMNGAVPIQLNKLM